MAAGWRVPEPVRAAVGDRLESLLTDLPIEATTRCQVCGLGSVHSLGMVNTVVVLATEPFMEPLLGVAHHGCAPADGFLSRDGTLRALHRDDSGALGRRGNCGEPHAVMVVQHGVRGFFARGGLSNAFVSAMLDRGFELLRTDVSAVDPAVAPGWQLGVVDGSLRLTDPDGAILSSTRSADSTRWWEKLASSQGSALVVAGTDLGLTGRGVGPERMAEETAAGRVVVGVVPFRRTRPWWRSR